MTDESNKYSSQDEEVQSLAQRTSDENSLANGVAEIEAVTQTWTRTGLYVSWGAIILLATAMGLQTQTIGVYTNYATSSFTQFSLLSTLQVVQGVMNVAIRPPLAKFIDTVGRLEGFILSVVSITLGTILLAASPNIGTYFAGQIFMTLGQVGINFMTTAFAFDSSDMVHRALLSVLPGFCYLFVPWTNAPITTAFLEHSTWRWGIGMWAIVLPICSLPLFAVLVANRIKAKRLGVVRKKFETRKFLRQLDLGGSILLAAGLSLVFIAIPLASSDAAEWRKAHIIVMIVIGGLCLIAFPIYEWYVPSYPIVSFKVFKNWEIAKSFLFIMFYYLGYYIYAPYFFGWLMVVFNLSNTGATNVSAVAGVATTFSAIVGAIAIKYTRNIKWFIVSGASIMMIGVGLIFKFREIGTSTAKLVIAQTVDGLGAGLMTTPNQVLVQSYCIHSEVAQTTSLYLSFLSLGQVVGDAISGSVYRKYYLHYLRQNLPGQNETWIQTIYNDYTQALVYPMTSDTRIGIVNSYNEVMRILLIPPFAIYGTMLLLGLSFPDIRLDKINDGLKGLIFGDVKPMDSSDIEAEHRAAKERGILNRLIKKIKGRND